MAFLRDKRTLRFFGVFFVSLFLIPFGSHGQTEQSQREKIYEYNNIDVVYTVKRDTTVQVQETQEFSFLSGEFHQGWREIPRNKIDGVSDVHVTDIDTGEIYTYSNTRLDKTSPSSWGKFTVFNQNGKTIIEWYYSAKTSLHSWRLDYTLHGSLGFYSNGDELYLNVFDSYTVPVKSVTAKIVLPSGIIPTKTNAFRTNSKNSLLVDGLTFSTTDVAPQEAFTILALWPQGSVDRSQYIWSFLRFHYGIISLCLLVFGSILFSIFYILIRRKKERDGRGTIIPEYEPPDHLRPFVGEVMTSGYVTGKGLSATIVDLAVRGYVTIEEDNPSGNKFLKKMQGKSFLKLFSRRFLGLLFTVLIIWFVFSSKSESFLFGLFIVVLVLSLLSSFIHRPTEYFIQKKKNFHDDGSLEDFEKQYLTILFGSSDTFSTRALKKFNSGIDRQAFGRAVQKLQRDVVKEVERDTNAYIHPVSRSQKYIGVVVVSSIFIFMASLFISHLIDAQIVMVFDGFYFCVALLVWIIKFRTILSEKGKILREQWLGFKLYLGTAEKYRLENLTTETFEKFLPYAMVFGLEKKWANAFKEINVPPPSWYRGVVVAGSPSVGVGSGFSASAFSASFASSFSSSISSSGAGGGGSAGGGGGGGGGGAS